MAQTLVSLMVHVVFSSKNRQPLITPEVEPELYAYMGGDGEEPGVTLPRRRRDGKSSSPIGLAIKDSSLKADFRGRVHVLAEEIPCPIR